MTQDPVVLVYIIYNKYGYVQLTNGLRSRYHGSNMSIVVCGGPPQLVPSLKEEWFPLDTHTESLFHAGERGISPQDIWWHNNRINMVGCDTKKEGKTNNYDCYFICSKLTDA